jgi:hypothetical protein
VGETKFFKQCSRIVVGDSPAFCWEHAPQERVRANEQSEGEWRPIGAYPLKPASDETNPARLKALAVDDQNVHTPEVQGGVSAAIRKLWTWAQSQKIKTEHDLVSTILKKIKYAQNATQAAALAHLRACYSYHDDTLMFGVTYPMLASWVWARILHSKNDVLMDRFFEEVKDSAGQCLNGNMARLMNVFAAIDEDLSPQDAQPEVSKESLQVLVAKAVDSDMDLSELMNAVQTLLQKAGVPTEEWGIWIDAVIEARE